MFVPDFTVDVGEARVTVPAEPAARAYLEKLLGSHLPVSRHTDQAAPAIGKRTPLGIYAGITLHGEQPMALYLLEGEKDELTWDDARIWAEAAGGELPSRIDSLLLFKRLKGEFQEASYWTSEVDAAYADAAWSQDFGYGCQGYWRKSDKLRARAVRRVVI